jgi:hypothetical protein
MVEERFALPGTRHLIRAGGGAPANGVEDRHPAPSRINRADYRPGWYAFYAMALIACLPLAPSSVNGRTLHARRVASSSVAAHT